MKKKIKNILLSLLVAILFVVLMSLIGGFIALLFFLFGYTVTMGISTTIIIVLLSFQVYKDIFSKL